MSKFERRTFLKKRQPVEPKRLRLSEIQETVNNPEVGFASVENLREDVEETVGATETIDKNGDRITETQRRFKIKLFDEVEVETKEQAIERALSVCEQTFSHLQSELKIQFDAIEPGHGLGHLARDYMNGLRLMMSESIKNDIDPKQLFIGFVAGMMHDIGVAIVPRYREDKTPVGHAEAGALLLGSTLQGVNPTERKLIQYAVSASTHYLVNKKFKGENGAIKYLKQPYTDTYQDETGETKPVFAIWLARWIDRLDCSGPAFGIGRHPLTTLESHKDATSQEHFLVEFGPHWNNMDPQRKGGQLAHLEMFRASQVKGNMPGEKTSPYNQFDNTAMIALRDPQAARLGEIINAVQNPVAVTPERKKAVLSAWQEWLGTCAEPGNRGKQRAAELIKKFTDELDEHVQTAWINGIEAGLMQYIDWAEDMTKFLNTLSSEQKRFFGLLDDDQHPTADIMSVVTPPASVYALF